MSFSRALLCGLILAALAGSPSARDGQTRVVGWRGDGTGKYPEATPPTSWGRVSSALRGLRFQASRPAATDAGAPMADGVIREWLVLSPAPEGTKVEKDYLPEEADLSPREGDPAWKKVVFETAWLDFRPILGNADKAIAYACTNVYSETGGKFRINATHLGAFRIVLNGKPLPQGYGRFAIDLAKGWNRLMVKVATRDSDWACGITLHARAPAEYDSHGIAWATPLPGVQGGFYGGGTGCGSPVIVGDRIYLLSEPHDLVCLNKADGKVLWDRPNSFFDAATETDRTHAAYPEAEKLAKKLNDLLAAGPLSTARLEEKGKLEKDLYARMQEIDPVRYKKQDIPDVGYSGYTPVTDGRFIYLWLGTGVTACYDLEGRRQWIRADVLPAVEHGFSSSPVLVDGKVVVFMRDLFAFEASSGRQAWRIPVVPHEGANPPGFFHGTPVAFAVGGVPLIVLGNGTIVRASDGKVLAKHPDAGNQAVSSPVVDGNRIFETATLGMKFYIHTLPGEAADPMKEKIQALSVDTPAFPKYYLPWYIASPVVHDGLAYLLNNSGVLTVVDVAEAKIVYQRMVDLDHFQTANEGPARGIGISPALGGKYLYLFGNNGGALVLEPGRAYKQVAKNKIESLVSVGHWGERQERFVANPVFDGSRIYLRGEGHLYALDAKSGAGPATKTIAAETPVSKPVPKPGAPEPRAAPTPDEPVSPVYGWRRNGSGRFPEATPPLEWSEKKNVAWRTRVGAGSSTPTVTPNRVFVVSEPGTLVGLDRADGKILWEADVSADLPAGLKIPDIPGPKQDRARPTPVADGTAVYVALGTGVVARYSADGKREWVQVVDPAPLSYGASASPVLAGNILLVDGRRLKGLDAATGRVAWEAKVEPHYGSPALVTLEGVLYAVTAKGAVVRVSDGTVMAKDIAEGLGGDQSPSPVVRDGVVTFAYHRCTAVTLAAKDGRIQAKMLWEQELPGDVIASPILHNGMLFAVVAGSGEYRVLDAKTGAVLLEKDLELPPNYYPSLTLVGTHLLVGNDRGETLVLEAARDSKEVRRNQIPDGSGATPAPSGRDLFLRGGEFLYCVGAR